MLINTAYGLGNLRGLVEKLTDKPVIVANTHGHLDHSGGNGEWERVYMHKNAVIDHVTLKDGPCDVNTLPYLGYDKIFIEEGYVFDMGGRKVEVIDITSHSSGSLAFLDTAHGFLFSGDELEPSQVLLFELAPEVEYDLKAHLLRHKANMEKLASRADE